VFLSLKSTPQQQLRSYVTAVDRVFTRVSPYLFTMLVVIAVGWSIENAPRTQISLNRDYRSAPGAVLDLNLPVSMKCIWLTREGTLHLSFLMNA
jgi:hypothetical protein